MVLNIVYHGFNYLDMFQPEETQDWYVKSYSTVRDSFATVGNMIKRTIIHEVDNEPQPFYMTIWNYLVGNGEDYDSPNTLFNLLTN